MAFDSLDRLREALVQNRVTRLYVKPLAENDNSKQGIYFGGGSDGFASVQHLSVVEFVKSSKGDALWAELPFAWLSDAGTPVPAPNTKLILYGRYPEVRLSGFLWGCPAAPAAHLRPTPREQRRFNNEPDGRVLILGVRDDQTVVARLAAADSSLARELQSLLKTDAAKREGVFFELLVRENLDPRQELLRLLRSVYAKGPIVPSRFTEGLVVPLPKLVPHAAGYTLEAALGIAPNGRSEPDFMGWEVKSYGKNVITMMTPEPDYGVYYKDGAAAFLSKYGRNSGLKRQFTGRHVCSKVCRTTSLVLELNGYDPHTRRVDMLKGMELVDSTGEVAAGWTYAKVAAHWSRKHASAVYVRYEKTPPPPHFRYRSPVLMGEGTDFGLLLHALASGAMYYDPGLSMPLPVGAVKRRSQFRVRIAELPTLYRTFEKIDLS